jgi:predicted anti-sigma-YlaC factor YlaD
MEGLLAERASGEMKLEDAARLEAHLAGCPGCQAELRAYQETFQMARLPPPETRIGELDVSTFSAYQRRRRRGVTRFTIGAGFAAAAVAASVVVVPALLTLRTLPRQATPVATAGRSYEADASDLYATWSRYAYGDSTFGRVAGTDEYQGNGGTQLAVASRSTTEVLPEDAALAAFDEIDEP